MKTVAICHPSIRDARNDFFFSEITLNDQPITIGLIDTDHPALPKEARFDKYVLVKKSAFSCNYRDRALMLHFDESCRLKTTEGSSFFSPVGSEFSAEVIQAGKGVTNLTIGDRVIPDGAFPTKPYELRPGLPTNFASQRFEIFHENHLCKIPKAMSDETAASFTIGAQTVYSMIRKLSIEPGMNVLITAGTSNTSLFALEALKNTPANLYVLTSSYKDFERFKDYGIKGYIPSPLQYEQAIHNMAKQIGYFDIVIDPFSDLYLFHAIRCMNFNGRYITCGFYNQHTRYDQLVSRPQAALDQIMTACITRNISIIGNCLGERADLEKAVRDFEAGALRVKIDSVYSDNSIQEFFDRTFNAKNRFGKVVYRYSDT